MNSARPNRDDSRFNVYNAKETLISPKGERRVRKYFLAASGFSSSCCYADPLAKKRGIPASELGGPKCDAKEPTMFRRDLIDLLLGNPMTLAQIARHVGESPGQIADDLSHLLRSLKHTPYKAVIESARCRACAFE